MYILMYFMSRSYLSPLNKNTHACFPLHIWNTHTGLRVLNMTKCNMQNSFDTYRGRFVIIGNAVQVDLTFTTDRVLWEQSGGGMRDGAVRNLPLSWTPKGRLISGLFITHIQQQGERYTECIPLLPLPPAKHPPSPNPDSN